MNKLVLLFISFFSILYCNDEKLFLALTENNIQQLEELLILRGNANIRDANGYTLLHWAALANNIPAVELLLAYGAHVNAQGNALAISIFLLQGNCTPEALENLLKPVMRVNAQANGLGYGIFINKQVPLMGLVHSTSNLPQFISRSDNLAADYRGSLAFKNPCINQEDPHIEIFHDLTPLHFALLSQSADVAKLLLAHGAQGKALCSLNQNTKKATMLEWAQRLSTPEIVSLIEQYKKDRNFFLKTKQQPMQAQLGTGAQYPEVQQLHYKANATGTKNTLLKLLFKSVESNDLEAVLKILRCGINPNRRDTTGTTALHKAVQLGYKYIVELLLNFQADPNAKNRQGDTSLHTVIQASNLNTAAVYTNIARLLLASGADVDAKNNQGLTPLATALIDTPTALAFKQETNSAHFFSHVAYCSQDLIILLLCHGADFTVKNGILLSAAHYLKLPDISSLLLNYGAFTSKTYTDELETLPHDICKELINKALSTGDKDYVLRLLHKIPSVQEHIEPQTIKHYINLKFGTAKSSYRALELALVDYFEHVVKAIQEDDVLMVTRLLKNGFPLTISNEFGNSFLHIAAQSHSTTVFKLLLNLKPELINKRNRAGLTPFDLLDDKDSIMILSLLQDTTLK